MNFEPLLGAARPPAIRNIRNAASLLCMTTGVALWFAAAAGLVPSLYDGMASYLVLMPALFVLGNWFISIGKRLRAQTAAEAILSNPEHAPVLYLRSFGVDKIDEGFVRTVKTQERNIREEEILATIFSHLGPFIAVGEPDEVLPKLGAARAHLEMDGWEDQVEKLMQGSSLVVLRVSDTPGFQWEAKTAVCSLPPEKILFYFSQTLNAESLWKAYLALGQCINEYLPKHLSVKIEMDNARFLRFEKDWTPVLFGQLDCIPEPHNDIGERLQDYFAKLGLSRSRDKRLNRLSIALRPFFEARGQAPGKATMFPGSAIRAASLISGPLTAGVMMAFNLLRSGRSTRAMATLVLTAGLAVTLPLAAWSGWRLLGPETMGLVWSAWMLLFIYLMVAHGVGFIWEATSVESIKRHMAFGGPRVHAAWSALLVLGGAGLWWSYVLLVSMYLGLFTSTGL